MKDKGALVFSANVYRAALDVMGVLFCDIFSESIRKYYQNRTFLRSYVKDFFSNTLVKVHNALVGLFIST